MDLDSLLKCAEELQQYKKNVLNRKVVELFLRVHEAGSNINSLSRQREGLMPTDLNESKRIDERFSLFEEYSKNLEGEDASLYEICKGCTSAIKY